MHRRIVWTAAVAAVVLLGTSCGAKDSNGGGETGEEGTPTTAAASGAASGKFGDMDSPCGKAENGKAATVKADEAGTGTDKLYIGVANERTSQIRKGLLQEMWDSSNAFVKWCNEQGGIDGLQIGVVDLDGQLLQVEAAMTKGCHSVFGLVGGGFAQDNQMFTGKDGSDFHKCKLIAVPGFAVSEQFADASGQVQPMPNPAYQRSVTWLRDIAKLHPEEVKKTVLVYGNFPSLISNKDQLKLAAQTVDGFNFLDDIAYAPVGQDFKVTAQQIIDSGATAYSFVGEPENYASLLTFLQEGDYKGLPFVDGNQYDQLLFSQGKSAPNGVLIRQAIHTFEEADQWPATKQWLDIMKKYGTSDAKIASLGVQSFSAWLLFATAAKKCAESNGGEISRACVLDEAGKVTSWTGGGLHAETNPGGNIPPKCSLLIEARDGGFSRAYPEAGSPEDKGGFSCYDDGVQKITGDLGQGAKDPSYSR